MSSTPDRRPTLLRASRYFRGLADAQLARLASISPLVPFEVGDALVDQDTPARAMYVVASGEVEVFTADSGSGTSRVLRHLGEGECFGEVGFLLGRPRTASVRGRVAGELLVVRLRDLEALVMSAPEVGEEMARAMASWLLDHDSRHEQLFVKLRDYPMQGRALSLLSGRQARYYGAIPLRDDGPGSVAVIGLTDPFDLPKVDELRRELDRDLELVAIGEVDLVRYLHRVVPWVGERADSRWPVPLMESDASPVGREVVVISSRGRHRAIWLELDPEARMAAVLMHHEAPAEPRFRIMSLAALGGLEQLQFQGTKEAVIDAGRGRHVMLVRLERLFAQAPDAIVGTWVHRAFPNPGFDPQHIRHVGHGVFYELPEPVARPVAAELNPEPEPEPEPVRLHPAPSRLVELTEPAMLPMEVHFGSEAQRGIVYRASRAGDLVFICTPGDAPPFGGKVDLVIHLPGAEGQRTEIRFATVVGWNMGLNRDGTCAIACRAGHSNTGNVRSGWATALERARSNPAVAQLVDEEGAIPGAPPRLVVERTQMLA